MFRGRALRPHLATLILCGLAFALAGCIFSPETKKTDPKPPKDPAKSPAELIQRLKDAYADRDYDAYAKLFADYADDPNTPDAYEEARYLFFLNAPLENGQTNWGLTDELRIHRRMFDPEDIPVGDTPLRQELWLVDIDIALTQQGEFLEREDLYAPADRPREGLPRERYKAEEGVYSTYVFFQTQGDTHYQVNGRASFVVLEDRTKTMGQEGKFLIYLWNDLGSEKPTAAPVI